jgi:hypothetical protein
VSHGRLTSLPPPPPPSMLPLTHAVQQPAPKQSHATQPAVLCHTTTRACLPCLPCPPPSTIQHEGSTLHLPIAATYAAHCISPSTGMPLNWCTTRCMRLHCSAHRSANWTMMHLGLPHSEDQRTQQDRHDHVRLATHPTEHCPAITTHRFTSWPAAAAGCVAPVPAW